MATNKSSFAGREVFSGNIPTAVDDVIFATKRKLYHLLLEILGSSDLCDSRKDVYERSGLAIHGLAPASCPARRLNVYTHAAPRDDQIQRKQIPPFSCPDRRSTPRDCPSFRMCEFENILRFLTLSPREFVCCLLYVVFFACVTLFVLSSSRDAILPTVHTAVSRIFKFLACTNSTPVCHDVCRRHRTSC